jgi:hypothetical protein
LFPGAEVPSNPVLLCPAKHANRQQPPTLMSRSPARKAPALSLSKTQNVTKLTSQISSSRRMFSWLSRASRVIVSNDGGGVAMDAPLASDNDNPAAPRTGTVLLRRFRFEFPDTEILPRLTAHLTLKPLQDTLNKPRMHTPPRSETRSRVVASTFSTRRSLLPTSTDLLERRSR